MRFLRNNKGFTLVEMLIVMLVISVLLLLTIPNIAKQREGIMSKGCEAYEKMVYSQVEAYYLENNVYPGSISDLADFLGENPTCPDGHTITISAGGTVTHGKATN